MRNVVKLTPWPASTQSIVRFMGILQSIWALYLPGTLGGEDSSIPNTRGIRSNIVKALKQLNIPILRWPGGCFADEYHWMDGSGTVLEMSSGCST